MYRAKLVVDTFGVRSRLAIMTATADEHAEIDRMMHEYDNTRHEQLNQQYLYVIDCGSFFEFNSNDSNQIVEILRWNRIRLNSTWDWSIDIQMQPGDNDLRVRMWISFDSASDAMLARLTWLDLRSKEHAFD